MEIVNTYNNYFLTKNFITTNFKLNKKDKEFIDSCDDLSVFFNVKDFYRIQGLIAEKFPNPKEREIDMIDSFILHIMEEAEEYNEEDILMKKAEEFIDCINYTFSFFYSFIKRYPHLNKKLNEIQFIIFSNDNNYSENFEKNLTNIISENLIWNIRRLYPERKYHKPYNELNNEEKIERSNKVFDYFIELIKILIIKFFYQSKIDIDTINGLIGKKQNFILNELKK